MKFVRDSETRDICWRSACSFMNSMYFFLIFFQLQKMTQGAIVRITWVRRVNFFCGETDYSPDDNRIVFWIKCWSQNTLSLVVILFCWKLCSSFYLPMTNYEPLKFSLNSHLNDRHLHQIPPSKSRFLEYFRTISTTNLVYQRKFKKTCPN